MNLTPDPDTGLGTWSDAEIVRAIRSGQRKDGRLLAPVMPYEWFHEMSDADALAVARYLKSLAPVRHEVKQNPSVAFKLGKLFVDLSRDLPQFLWNLESANWSIAKSRSQILSHILSLHMAVFS